MLYPVHRGCRSEEQASGIGAILIEFSLQAAGDASKKKLVLDVRERNKTARRFFMHQGFSEDKIVHRRSDQLMDRGPAIEMSRPVSMLDEPAQYTTQTKPA